jgi:hypothetical protein
MNKSLNFLSIEEKVDFFVDCQKLLIKYHPNSDFLIRENNLNQALETFSDQIEKYKGYFYNDDYVYILWNQIYIEDPQNIVNELIKNAYKEPNPDYNAISLDFVACRNWGDTFNFIKKVNEDKIKYILLVKNGNPKIYNKEELINKIKFS